MFDIELVIDSDSSTTGATSNLQLGELFVRLIQEVLRNLSHTPKARFNAIYDGQHFAFNDRHKGVENVVQYVKSDPAGPLSYPHLLHSLLDPHPVGTTLDRPKIILVLTDGSGNALMDDKLEQAVQKVGKYPLYFVFIGHSSNREGLANVQALTNALNHQPQTGASFTYMGWGHHSSCIDSPLLNLLFSGIPAWLEKIRGNEHLAPDATVDHDNDFSWEELVDLALDAADSALADVSHRMSQRTTGLRRSIGTWLTRVAEERPRVE